MSVVSAPPRVIGSMPRAIQSLWAELAPTPGRWRRSVLIGFGTMTALVLDWTLQVPRFSAPVIAFMALQPSNVCSWRNVPPRLALATAGAVVSITVAGVLVQLPWLLLPAFFAGVALIAYFCPITRCVPRSTSVCSTRAACRRRWARSASVTGSGS